ncbi:hypothetical protein PPYR_01634 [Photinus pyralis]|uniref:ZP domain-containing protein n=1 Tax=Photinus pyralis TaxID=7054 RepID=A0A5N4B536_PHOPY|nr:uncharacterized protein LOC116168822 isoform X2 [Photinus pyralis]KAB0804664.1 hypothetical protein PPYR_01634 [Photinus pyralis]
MRNYPFIPNMVQAITVLTVLKMMTKAQTSCGTGSMNGKVMYERLPNIQLQGFDDDIVRDTAPPFMVLEKCQDLCLRDRASNNIVRTCTSFDFQPGSRIATYNGGPEYEESTCYLTREQAAPEGIGNLMTVPNSVHFTEVCVTSNRPERECPNRRYIFERHPRKKLKLPAADIKEMTASNRSECEDKCLNEFSFVCRSATFDSSMRTCILSRFTRRTHPELLEDDPSADYLENTCLNAERRCDGLAVFIKEENKRLGGPFEVDLFTNITLEDCQAMCVRAEKYFCRSLEYDEMTKQCILSEEDSISQKDDLGVSSSQTHHFFDFACLDSPRGSEYPDNSVTSHLFSGKRPDTAFQRYRNSRLGGDHHSEISGRSLSECLDECLRQPSFQCRSAVYSERYRTCRLSRYNQRDGMRIIYDADYDYYENLMLGGDGDGSRPPGESGTSRPGETYPGSHHRPGIYSPSSPGVDYYPGGKYKPGRPYPDYPDRYPNDIYPGDRRRPVRPLYPDDDRRYPIGPPYDRYPPSGSGSRYPPSGGGSRYPPTTGSRYPTSGGGSRYPSSDGGSRYPSPDGGSRYPPSGSGSRYPPSSSGGNRYPSYDRYPVSVGGRYPYDKYPTSGTGDRYPQDGRYPPSDKYPNYPPSGGGYRDRYPNNAYDDRYDNRYGSDYGGRYGGSDDRKEFDYKYYWEGKFFKRPEKRPNRPFDNRPYDDDRQYPNDVRPYDDRRPVYTYRPSDGDRGYDHRRPYDGRRPTDVRKPAIGGDRRPFGGAYDERPPYDFRRPFSPGPDGPIYDGDSLGTRPYGYRCEEGDSFKQTGARHRLRKQFVRRFIITRTVADCERECTDSRDFTCRSFNYRDTATGYDGDKENCELSDRDTRDLELDNPQIFDTTGGFNYYERALSRTNGDGDCLDVRQICNEDGMEFTLITPEGFYGRIYAYGFYDRCFIRGNGGVKHILRISGAQGYPECGTQRYGDTMTNIVVVQFSDHVQTGVDKRFNLTCLFRGPGEAVVYSDYIGAGSGSPIPIEYLPAENTLSSKVRLLILYQGRPTTTIAVGDPLTFRLEAQDGYNYVTDIFATNVIARDPYSGRSVQLIDRRGCPVDPYVFPELDKGRSGDSLEARFNAFKIPESNFLVFEATVHTCRDGCKPAFCETGRGREEPSFGRRKREINDTIVLDSNNTSSDAEFTKNETAISLTDTKTDDESDLEFVREMIEVFESREELQQEARRAVPLEESVCLTTGEYKGLVGAVLSLIILLVIVAIIAGVVYRRYWSVVRKNFMADRDSTSSYPTRSSGLSTLSIFGSGLQKPFSGFIKTKSFPSMNNQDLDIPCSGPGGPFEDPSEPIYTDPSLFERSRSLRSIAVSQKRKLSSHQPM